MQIARRFKLHNRASPIFEGTGFSLKKTANGNYLGSTYLCLFLKYRHRAWIKNQFWCGNSFIMAHIFLAAAAMHMKFSSYWLRCKRHMKRCYDKIYFYLSFSPWHHYIYVFTTAWFSPKVANYVNYFRNKRGLLEIKKDKSSYFLFLSNNLILLVSINIRVVFSNLL